MKKQKDPKKKNPPKREKHTRTWLMLLLWKAIEKISEWLTDE